MAARSDSFCATTISGISTEIALLDQSDNTLRGNHRKLVRLFKQWKRHCNVPIKSFHLEQLIGEALPKL
ncbi:hypothetical protein, partial [Phaeovulum veldkampii]